MADPHEDPYDEAAAMAEEAAYAALRARLALSRRLARALSDVLPFVLTDRLGALKAQQEAEYALAEAKRVGLLSH